MVVLYYILLRSIRKIMTLTVKMVRLPCFDKKFMVLHLHSLLPLWTDNAFATIGPLTRPQIPLVTTETKETSLCFSGPFLLRCYSFSCFPSLLPVFCKLFWLKYFTSDMRKKRKVKLSLFIFASESLITVDLCLKAGTGGHKHHSHGKVCRKPQFVFSFSVKRFHCSS